MGRINRNWEHLITWLYVYLIHCKSYSMHILEFDHFLFHKFLVEKTATFLSNSMCKSFLWVSVGHGIIETKTKISIESVVSSKTDQLHFC